MICIVIPEPVESRRINGITWNHAESMESHRITRNHTESMESHGINRITRNQQNHAESLRITWNQWNHGITESAFSPLNDTHLSLKQESRFELLYFILKIVVIIILV